MSRNIILIMLIIVAVAIGGFFLYQELGKKTPADGAPSTTTQELVPITSGQANAGAQGNTEGKYHQIVTIDSQSFFFNPDVFTVKRGEKVTINVRAQGDHTFVIDELKINKKTPDGVTTKIEFTPEQEGALRFYCDKPGHKEAGQMGVIIVE
ncbi:MAG: cupredoxin domain-containing protein [Candidatus Azambacteria bacterium]|nr:cupredoxin domain-containing protein [Candidatus Azambacteria bacterium]